MLYAEQQLTIEHERVTPQGVYPLLRAIDESVREVKNEQYILRRETSAHFTELERETGEAKRTVTGLTVSVGKIEEEMPSLKTEMKEVRGDISEIKGDIKALAAGFGAAQARFNWGLVILGIIIALIQLLK